MKELGALVLLIVVIAAGWNQPFNAHIQSVVPPAAEPRVARAQQPVERPPVSVAAARPVVTPVPDRSWMWRKTTMDESYKERGQK